MSEDVHDDLKKTEDVLPNPEENPRNVRFKQIADAEEQHKKDGEELVDVQDEDHDRATPVAEAEEKVEEQEAAPAQKFKIKANGAEQELTQEELIKLAEKAAGADAKFEEAARMRREAEELRRAPPVKEVQAEPTVEDDDRALARALQMGSEEEAAGVIKRIRSQAVNPGQVAGMVEMITSGNWFRQEYPEIFADPWLTKIALDEDEKLVQSGDRRPYKERYKSIGDKLREWKGTQAARTEVKNERKATLHAVPKADVRAAAPEEGDDNKTDAQVNQEFIRAEAKRRGQTYVR